MRGSHEQLYRQSPNFQRSFKNRQAALDAEFQIRRFYLDSNGQNAPFNTSKLNQRRKAAYIERYKNTHPPIIETSDMETRLREQDTKVRKMIASGLNLTPEWRSYAKRRGIEAGRLDNRRAS